ncbi:uncharacterized protein LOC110209804 [Phascolarctos cinereus]
MKLPLAEAGPLGSGVPRGWGLGEVWGNPTPTCELPTASCSPVQGRSRNGPARGRPPERAEAPQGVGGSEEGGQSSFRGPPPHRPSGLTVLCPRAAIGVWSAVHPAAA